MRKRWTLIAVLALVLSAVLLTACGPQPAEVTVEVTVHNDLSAAASAISATCGGACPDEIEVTLHGDEDAGGAQSDADDTDGTTTKTGRVQFIICPPEGGGASKSIATLTAQADANDSYDLVVTCGIPMSELSEITHDGLWKLDTDHFWTRKDGDRSERKPGSTGYAGWLNP